MQLLVCDVDDGYWRKRKIRHGVAAKCIRVLFKKFREAKNKIRECSKASSANFDASSTINKHHNQTLLKIFLKVQPNRWLRCKNIFWWKKSIIFLKNDKFIDNKKIFFD